jgi:hypothetical protein
MFSLVEWVDEHSFLLLVVAAVGCTAVPLLVRRWPRWVWPAWAGFALFAVGGTVFLLHTPPATVSEHRPRTSAFPITADRTDSRLDYRELSLKSEEEIEELLAAGPKPTLVEVYVDYGVG